MTIFLASYRSGLLLPSSGPSVLRRRLFPSPGPNGFILNPEAGHDNVPHMPKDLTVLRTKEKKMGWKKWVRENGAEGVANIDQHAQPVITRAAQHVRPDAQPDQRPDILQPLERTLKETELQRQKQIKRDEDIASIQLDKQKAQEEVMLRQQKLEQGWLERKLQLQTELNERGTPQLSSINTRPTNTAVKLQKYTITPFRGEYMDWLRFWTQFTVEVDNSNIAEISKFNYLMELVREEP
eukprot:gene1893-2148_t